MLLAYILRFIYKITLLLKPLTQTLYSNFSIREITFIQYTLEISERQMTCHGTEQ